MVFFPNLSSMCPAPELTRAVSRGSFRWVGSCTCKWLPVPGQVRCRKWSTQVEKPPQGSKLCYFTKSLTHEFLLPFFPAFMMKGHQKCMCRSCALKWGLRDLVSNEQVKRILGGRGQLSYQPESTASLPSLSWWLYSPHGTQHLGLVTVGACLTAPIEMQDLGGWHKFMTESLSYPPQHAQGIALCMVYLPNVHWVHKKKYPIYTE